MTGTLGIYVPQSYNLKKENISTSKLSFVDLSIIIENQKFKSQLCDTKAEFPFSIICMPHLEKKNISSNTY